ncbi:MAG: response regulator transcription factor [Nitrospiraceae bacterium]|nr:response regulator transcription factor [Nitrospiraceae bacterium]
MKRLRILLCDDESQMLSLLQSVLEPKYSVVGTAEDGQALIATAQALRPDLVLTDIEMPRMDGIEAVQELRKTLPDCRVIFHTSRTEPEIMAAAFSAGASGYLIKGSTQSLISTIRTVVRHVWNQEEEIATGRAACHMN